MVPISGGILAHGDDNLPAFTVASAFTDWEPWQLLTIGVIAAVALYLWGVRRLARRGDHWPVGRTIVFLAGGVAPIALVTLGGIGAYDDELLSMHMVQHMVLAMVSPIFLALGAPVTLALRALPARSRHTLVAVLHSRVVKVLSFPLVSFGLYVATPFALYFTPLYLAAEQHEWLHNLVHIHFILIGCLFFWPLVGLDPLPGRWPYPARALLMIMSTPFHAVLGLTIMQSRSLIGGDYYPSLHLDWVNPFDDQRVAGGILWAGGELVSVLMLGALVIQWMRSSDREAKRIDRALDRAEADEPEVGPDGTYVPPWALPDRSPADRSAADSPAGDSAPGDRAPGDRAPEAAAAVDRAAGATATVMGGSETRTSGAT